ncbi:hypothetical protein D3C75_333180 [compost metagenome]
MTTQYEIVLVRSDKEPETIATVDSNEEVRKITETARYAGAWVNDQRKILRYGRGELRVHIRDLKPKIVACNTIIYYQYRAYDLEVQNDPTLASIRINAHLISGYDRQDKQLWETPSFRELSEIIGKELAYVCSRYYDQFINEFKLASAM